MSVVIVHKYFIKIIAFVFQSAHSLRKKTVTSGKHSYIGNSIYYTWMHCDKHILKSIKFMIAGVLLAIAFASQSRINETEVTVVLLEQ